MLALFNQNLHKGSPKAAHHRHSKTMQMDAAPPVLDT